MFLQVMKLAASSLITTTIQTKHWSGSQCHLQSLITAFDREEAASLCCVLRHAELRKPLIERKRRERINCSLDQLKGIMVDAYNLDTLPRSVFPVNPSALLQKHINERVTALLQLL
ncbi:UNVERIFIED_CONTAM: hypothetical protein FKN15_003638 [Acipenser sinensis]